MGAALMIAASLVIVVAGSLPWLEYSIRGGRVVSQSGFERGAGVPLLVAAVVLAGYAVASLIRRPRRPVRIAAATLAGAASAAVFVVAVGHWIDVVTTVADRAEVSARTGGTSLVTPSPGPGMAVEVVAASVAAVGLAMTLSGRAKRLDPNFAPPR